MDNPRDVYMRELNQNYAKTLQYEYGNGKSSHIRKI